MRSVVRLLATEIGDYAIVDAHDRRGALRRLEIAHADPSKRARLRVACADADVEGCERVIRLFVGEGAAGELVARITRATRAKIADVVLPDEPTIGSYMAAVVSVSGAPWGVLTMIATSARRYDDGDLALLVSVADWCGLGIENALRRELQPRASIVPSILPPAEGERGRGRWETLRPGSAHPGAPRHREKTFRG